MTPKSEATAFRIWQYAKPREWDVTYIELAEVLDVPVQTISSAAHGKGWHDRITSTSTSWRIDAVPRYAAMHLARDIAAGRVTYDPT